MKPIKVLGLTTSLSVGLGNSVPSIDGVGAEYVILMHDHNGGGSHPVEIRTELGSPIGSILVAPQEPIIIKKERDQLVFCASTDVLGSSVVYQG